ncbi:MAG: right-handed parallel beta-helix repeat-containing protein [Thermoplasmatales archaeon]|nr:right-handed parallel beta-helix repeat-containing protein [Thermoplasmatales archaeon]
MEGNILINKGVVVAVILLFISVSVIPSSGTNVVEKSSILSFDGNMLYVGGSGPGNYSSIQNAIDDASKGDTVFVYDDSSPYCENIIIDKEINVVGQNKETTVINSSYENYVVEINAKGVTLSDFTIQNGKYWSSIQIWSDWCIISNNIIKYNDGRGITFQHTLNYCIIQDNIIINNNGTGILFLAGNNFQVQNNTIRNNNGEGISLNGCHKNNIIDNNIINNNGQGLILADCTYTIIEGNNICNNTKNGIDVYHSQYGNYSHNNSIDNNYVCHNDWNGIEIRAQSRDNIISNNSVIKNIDFGIDITYYSNRNIVTDNYFSENEYGIVINLYSRDNIIKRNILENNFGGIEIYSYCENNNLSRNIFTSNHQGLTLSDRCNNSTIMNNCFKFNYYGFVIGFSSSNIVTRNDFIKNIIKVHSVGSHNYWKGNFWGRPMLFPKLIFGRDWLFINKIVFLDGIDWHPAQEPYDIGV